MGKDEGSGGFQRIARSWDKHLGLIVGGATSVMVALKLLAVANWNPTTAFGILSASGTANVLTGTILAVLPLLYAYAFLFFFPLVRRKMQSRTPVERSAAGMLGMWPVLILIFITPAYLLAVILVMLALMAVIPRIIRAFQKRRKTRKDLQRTATQERPSRFEGASVALSGVVMLSYLSLATPWMPAEIVEIDGAGRQTGYVLNESDGKAVVLLARGR